MVYYGYKMLFSALNRESWQKKDEVKRLQYLEMWSANTHHFIIVAFVIYNFCNSGCPGAYPMIWFESNTCFLMVDKLQVKLMAVTCGYFTQDYIVIKFLIKGTSAIDIQSKWHHVIGTLGIVCAGASGFALPGIINVGMLCEISSIFMSYRAMYKK